MLSHFSLLACTLTKTHIHRKTADCHTWLELNDMEINITLCTVTCQQHIVPDSFCRNFSIAVYFNCTFPAKIRLILVNLSDVNRQQV